jgi:hypothetical protein
VQLVDARERALLPRLARDPRRLLEDAAEARDELLAVICIDRADRRRL